MTAPLPQDLNRRLVSLGAARPLLVCVDYDGTLAPIAPRPEQAQLLPGAFDLLHRLARLPDTRVAIISGRSRDNLRTHSDFDEPILLIGSHVAELPGKPLISSGAVALDALETLLAPICAASPGAWVERKPLGITVHVRQASATDASRVLDQVRGVLAHRPALQVTEGKAVVELSLSRVNKGDAVRWLRTGWGGVDPMVIYFGDDVTDEAAFAGLDPGDVGIRVGAGSSIASHRVASEHDVLSVLTLLWRQRNGNDSG